MTDTAHTGRRRLLHTVASAALGTRFSQVAAQTAAPASQPAAWTPAHTVDYLVPAGPGAALDAAARQMKELLERRLGLPHPMIVSNRPGGSGTLAINALLAHAGDGHTLTTFTHSMLNHALIGESSVSWRDLTPIALLFEESIVAAVRADAAVKDAADLVAQLRRDPGALPIGVATSAGNHIHAAIAWPLKVAGVDVSRLTVVPFKSSAESMTALLGGHIALVSASAPNVVAPLASARIRVLATAAAQRLGGPLAAIPTWRELGVDASYTSLQGVLGPPGLPPAVLAYWEGLLRALSETAEWQQFLARQHWRGAFAGSAQMAQVLAAETRLARGLLETLGLMKTR
jgi:putative tricarboxylic transport membrane protein